MQIQRQTGATIQIDQGGDPCRVTIAGQPTAADQAKRLIDDIVAGGDPFRPGNSWQRDWLGVLLRRCQAFLALGVDDSPGQPLLVRFV